MTPQAGVLLALAVAGAVWLLWRSWTRPYAEFDDARRRQQALERISDWGRMPLPEARGTVRVVPSGIQTCEECGDDDAYEGMTVCLDCLAGPAAEVNGWTGAQDGFQTIHGWVSVCGACGHEYLPRSPGELHDAEACDEAARYG